jgi:hypothetical protein
MNKKVFFVAAVIFCSILFMNSTKANAQLFGADDHDMALISAELKKINDRLTAIDKSSLREVVDQMNAQNKRLEDTNLILTSKLIPVIQNGIEQNKQETLSSVGRTNSKLDDLEAEVKNQVLKKIHQQNKILELARQDQANLKEGLAQDIEKFEQASRSNFKDFSTVNQETLGKVVQQLEAQSSTTKKGFDDTIALFRTDVIPTIADENQKNRQMVLEHLTNANKETRKSLEAFFAKNQEVNQKLIEILQESLKQSADTKSLLDSIKKDLETIRASQGGAR